jgi:chromosome segregation ATPase
LQRREALVHEMAQDSETAAELVGRLRREADAHAAAGLEEAARRQEAEVKMEEAKEEARAARLELGGLREMLQTSACCRHVREMLQAAEEREVALKEGERQRRLECGKLQDEVAEVRAELDEASAAAAAMRQALAQSKSELADLEEQLLTAVRARDVEARRAHEVDARLEDLQAQLDKHCKEAASRSVCLDLSPLRARLTEYQALARGARDL